MAVKNFAMNTASMAGGVRLMLQHSRHMRVEYAAAVRMRADYGGLNTGGFRDQGRPLKAGTDRKGMSFKDRDRLPAKAPEILTDLGISDRGLNPRRLALDLRWCVLLWSSLIHTQHLDDQALIGIDAVAETLLVAASKRIQQSIKIAIAGPGDREALI